MSTRGRRLRWGTLLVGFSLMLVTACAGEAPNGEGGGDAEAPETDSESESEPTGDATSEAAEPEREPITLRFADIVPTTHFVAETSHLPFVEKVSELSDGLLTVEHFPEAQLGAPPDQLENLKNGVFDVAVLASAYHVSEMPMSDVFNLPTIATDTPTAALAFLEAASDGSSIIRQYDFDRNGVVPLATWATPLTQIASVGFDPTDLSELAQRQLRSSGGSEDLVVDALGGTPVSLTVAEQYEALQRGTVDGGLYNLPSLVSNRTMEVLTDATTNAGLGTVVGSLAINGDTWDGLPEWAQSVLIEAGREATQHFAETIGDLERETLSTLRDNNVSLHEFDEETLDALFESVAPVVSDWVQRSQDAGLEAERALAEAKDAVESVSSS